MNTSRDRSGFPLIDVPPLGLCVQLFPIAKVQLEMYLSEPIGFTDRWYDDLLQVSPRAPLHALHPDLPYERLLATGLQPAEIASLMNWFGEDFRSLTLQEWRWIYQNWHNVAPLPIPDDLAEPALGFWLTLQHQVKPRTLREQALLEGGVVEVISAEPALLALGKPRDYFWPNVWNPLLDDSPLPRPNERNTLLGCRFARRLP